MRASTSFMPPATPHSLLSVEYHFAFLTNKFFTRLLARSQWSQLKLHSSEMALTQNFSRQNRAIFLNQRQTKQRRNASASDAILFARLSERASGAASFLPKLFVILAKMVFCASLACEKWLLCCLEKNCVRLHRKCAFPASRLSRYMNGYESNGEKN